MENKQGNIYEDEKSLGQLILDIKDYALYVLRHWLIIILTVILFTALFVIYTFFQPTKYNAEISFVVTESSSSGGGGMMSALSSFGFGGFNQDGVNYNKIISLGKADFIHTQVLLDSAIVDGKNDLLGNHLIEVYELEGKWKTIEVYHLSAGNLEDLNLEERKLLRRLIKIVVEGKEPSFKINFNDESYILSCSVVSENEDFSKAMVEKIYDKLSNFYVMQSISQSRETVSILNTRKDSLEKVLDSKQVDLAILRDASQGILYSQYEVPQLNLGRDVQVTTAMYLEIVKNLEMARFNLSNIKPFFTPIDTPYMPLPREGKSWKKQGILGGFIGGFLIVLFIILRRYINDEIRAAEGK